MKFNSLDEFLKAVEALEIQYKNHFDEDIPSKILGWWDPVHLHAYTMSELEDSYSEMYDDIQDAIETNTPIEPMSDEAWDMTIF